MKNLAFSINQKIFNSYSLVYLVNLHGVSQRSGKTQDEVNKQGKEAEARRSDETECRVLDCGFEEQLFRFCRTITYRLTPELLA